MPIYVYETIPAKAGEKPVQFELQQSMRDEALKTHPETGQPVRRLISGGFGYLDKGKSHSGHDHGHCCGGSCGCH
ncbi:FmdB family zinc ribbon protein [Coraliomargarita parva]|uniref:FmdB family zinc ribbon protein n=1 Tax=Coraliomargarita parva TaxID=3014050 RepID=UPI0022B4EED2|nr:zinc ribbon domain-containing protein [Coraliomargarita parva]